MARPTVAPILDADLDEFTHFLSTHMGGAAPEMWRGVFAQPWCDDRPNYGFMLQAEGKIVGVIGGIYASRPLGGRTERFCNISCWSVLPEFRKHSMRLATALVAQEGYHFTDFTPTEVVVSSLKFLKFQLIDGRLTDLPNFLSLKLFGGIENVLDDPDEMRKALPTDQAKVMDDHLHLRWLRQLVIVDDTQPLHVIYKPLTLGRHLTAAVLGINDREQLTKLLPTLQAYLWRRHRISMTRLETRSLVKLPWYARRTKHAPKKLFLSKTLGANDIDSLYSEMTCLDLPGRYF